METATTKEALGFTNNTKAITPFTLRQALKLYPTVEDMKDAINNASIGGGEGVDLSDYLKKSELPTKLSAFENDKQFVALVNGYVPVSYLPSSFHNIEIHDSIDNFPYPGNVNKIYFNRTDNKFYTYADGYIEIGETLSLGYTADTAFRGDYGLEAYTHITEVGNVHNLTLADLQIAVSPDAINNLLGLDENILTLLSRKLDLSGGSLLGPLILQRDPVEAFEAATRNYVDREINSIGVKVTTNVNKIQSLEDTLDGQKEILVSQKDSIATITNKVTGVEESIKNTQENVLEIEKSVEGFEITIQENTKIVEDIQQSVKVFNCTLLQNSIIVPTDENSKALETRTYSIPFESTFKNSKVEPTSITINNNDGIIVSDASEIKVYITKGTTIQQKSYSIVFMYEDLGKTYVTGGVIAVIPINNNVSGGGGAYIGTKPPEDTSLLWVDTTEDIIKRYSITDKFDADGNPIYEWTAINKIDIEGLETSIDTLSEELKKQVESLNTTILNEVENKISMSAKDITFNYTEYTKDAIEGLQGTINETIKDINNQVQDLNNIKKYMSWVGGNLVFGETTEGSPSNAYRLHIDNDSIIIYNNGQMISQWVRDEFRVSSLVITMPGADHGFTFKYNTNGSLSLKRIKIEQEVTE